MNVDKCLWRFQRTDKNWKEGVKFWNMAKQKIFPSSYHRISEAIAFRWWKTIVILDGTFTRCEYNSSEPLCRFRCAIWRCRRHWLDVREKRENFQFTEMCAITSSRDVGTRGEAKYKISANSHIHTDCASDKGNIHKSLLSFSAISGRWIRDKPKRNSSLLTNWILYELCDGKRGSRETVVRLGILHFTIRCIAFQSPRREKEKKANRPDSPAQILREGKTNKTQKIFEIFLN